jgi:hypothetical protein
MDFGDNPFSLEPAAIRRSQRAAKRKSVLSAFKFLALVAACLVVTLVIAAQSRRWLLHQLTSDFASLSNPEKQARLIQIADLGPMGIEPLVQQLAAEDLEVARTAFELLREAQNQWILLSQKEQQRCHARMVATIESIAVQIPDDRTGWPTSLLQQTLMTTVQRKDEQATALYRDANHALELLSISDRAGPSILDAEPLDPNQPRRLTIRSAPLPVSAVDTVDQWTDWPPTQSQAGSAIEIVGRANDETSEDDSLAQTPTVYRSGAATLQPIQSGEAVILRDIDQPEETSHHTSEIQPVTHLVDSPMETFDDKSVMHWLGSPHQALREKAKLELITRGFDGTQIAIATQIAAGDVQTRMALVDKLAESSGIDPRPWLLMLLEDQSREVRLRVVSILVTMDDPDITQRLRLHLVDERDPTVAFRIRRNLDIR